MKLMKAVGLTVVVMLANVYEYDLFALPHRQIANELYAVLLNVLNFNYEDITTLH